MNRKYLNDQEQKELLESLRLCSNKRDYLFFTLALETGARVGELLAITVSDLDKDENAVFIRGTKGSKSREIPIRPELMDALVAFSRGGIKVFNCKYNNIRDRWARFWVSPKKLHCLRHTFAINLYKKTKDVRLVKNALGHKQIQTTQIYLDYIYSMSELRKALFE